MRASALPFYYGWCVLAASAVAELLAQGATSYASGLFVLPLQAEFHISRADANSAVLILFLGSALMAPLVGRALDRFPIRLVVCIGAAVFGAALAGIALAGALWQMALILFVPAALGFMAIGPLTTSTLAARWFWRRRGLAMGLAAIATSGGGLVVVPLLSQAIRAHGWRSALLGEAVIVTAIIIVLSLALLRDGPAAVGLADHAENQGRTAHSTHDRLRWHAILASAAFWRPSLALATVSGISQAVVVTLVPYGVAMGVSATQAAFGISAFALAAAITKIVAGVLADRVAPTTILVAALVAMIAAQALFCLAPGYAALVAAASLAGIALGGALPTAGSMMASAFGAGHFGAAMGWTYALVLAFAILATRFVGMVYDMSHGYGRGFAAFLGFCVVVLLFILLTARPRTLAS
jgi:MFS family permease